MKEEIERRIAIYQKNFDKADNKIARLSTDGRIASLKALLPFIDSLQQEQPSLPDNLDEAANKFAVLYDQGTCDGIAQECFKAGAQWMKEQMMNDAIEGTLAGQLLSSLTENGKQMVITVPRNTFPSNPKTKNIKLIIVKEN